MNPPAPRDGPLYPQLGEMGFHAMRWLTSWAMAAAGFHQLSSGFAKQTLATVRVRLSRGETVYLAGLGLPGTHNTGVALVEVSQAHGPRLIVNNEEERFSGVKHTTEYPRESLNALGATLKQLGLDYPDIAAWLTTWDYPTLFGTMARGLLEEMPASLRLLTADAASAIDRRRMKQMTRTPKILRKHLKLKDRVPLICMPHHDNHAWFSFATSPFDDRDEPVAIAVLDGTGDLGSISLYVARNGELQRLRCNNSVFDSLGAFYSVISSTQGGWTWLSCEGRYMGAAAWGDMNRETNPYYAKLREVLVFRERGEIRLNRSLANWQCDPFVRPYKPALQKVLGAPLQPHQLWNPDAVLRVEDIHHRPDTQERVDKAAATQMVFEDAMIHIVDGLLRETGAHRLVLTGGVALNALGNMRLLEHFDEAWFTKAQNRKVRLHLWVPPTPSDPGVTMGAAWRFAQLAGAPRGAPMTHAFYCGNAPTRDEITAALAAPDIATMPVGDISTLEGRQEIADLMAFVISRNGILALYQGSAETGPRALGHRSILANPCDAGTRERLNERVKYREAIRPLAPMATLAAAQMYFELQPGASDAEFNAYNYMVLTAKSKPIARAKIPAVIHADGTGRIQIVRPDDDPLTHEYLLALGRRIGVEVSVNTSFNVAGPIAQTPAHAVETLRRSKGMDVVLLVAREGNVFAAWHGGTRDSGRFTGWYAEWRNHISPVRKHGVAEESLAGVSG